MIWTPHVTVAAVVEENGRFLLVEEEAEGRRVFNQPAGHWEEGESLAEAAVRETLEETGYAFTPEAMLGIYHWRHPRRDITFLRVAFVGSIGGYDPDRPLDQGIIGPCWLSRAELLGRTDRLRSPQVLRCVDDYLAGRRYPLEMLVQV